MAAATAPQPVHPLAISRDRVLIVGVKITADRTYGVLTDLGADVLFEDSEVNPGRSVSDIVRTVGVVVRRLAACSPSARVDGVGVSVSGDVDRAQGTVRLSPLLGWQGVALRGPLEDELGIPVTVENDVRALTTSEHLFGAGRDASPFAVVTIGAGIGCGLYINGAVVEGANGVSGEIGHLPLASPSLVCSCGRRGCVEAVASTQAIVERIRASTGRGDLTIEEAFALAHDGDHSALNAFGEAGEVIGAALAALVNLVGPQRVILSGESVTEFELFEDRLRRSFAEHAFGAAANCELILAPHTFFDWARGAAVCVIDEVAHGERGPSRAG